MNEQNKNGRCVEISEQTVFKRYETKYIITKAQKAEIISLISARMRADEHGKSTICNLYFDTPDYRLIRRSIERPVYKEKLRIRSYGVSKYGEDVFAELKKKYKSVVYKRRLPMPNLPADDLIFGILNTDSSASQVEKEIKYFLQYYQDLSPRVFLAYDREAFYGTDDAELRITFDENIIWRDYDLRLDTEPYGERLTDEDFVIMEIKTPYAIPLWLTKILSDRKIYKCRFSKYGTVYINKILKNKR